MIEGLAALAALYILFKGIGDWCDYNFVEGIPETISGLVFCYALQKYNDVADRLRKKESLIKEQEKIISNSKDSNALKSLIIERLETELKSPDNSAKA